MYFDVFGLPSIISILIIVFLISYTLIKNFFSKKFYKLWSPLTFISLIYLYYVIIVPIVLLNTVDKVYYVGVDVTKVAVESWIAASVSLLSIHIGFSWYKGYKKQLWNLNLNFKSAFKIGLFLFVLGLFLFTIFNGLQLSLVQSKTKTEFSNEGGFAMYFTHAISFLVCASVLFIPAILKKRKYLLLFIPIGMTVLIYIVGGFRYRLVYLVIAAATMYHLYTKKRINLILWLSFSVVFYLFMGVMESSRSYGNGLDLTRAEGMSTADFANTGMNEGRIFFYSGKVIEIVSETGEYIYFEPTLTALLMPIPRKIFSAKPDGAYLTKIQTLIMGSSRENPGAAFLHYAEAFFSFGWFGIIINGFLLGVLSKFFWVNYLRNPKNIMIIAALALFNGFTYIMISRGYMAQQLTLFLFYLIIPLWLMKKMNLFIRFK